MAIKFYDLELQKDWEAIPERVKREYRKKFEKRMRTINKIKKSKKPTKWDD